MNRTHRGTTGSPGTQRARFPGGDRALATTSGRHHGQAIRIDSFEVDDSLILGPPPGLVKARRRILATPVGVRIRNVVRGSRGKGAPSTSPTYKEPYRRIEGGGQLRHEELR